MADYAGAVAAIRARFEAAAIAPTEFQNEDPPSAWPPTPPAPWIYFEVMQTASELRGAGLPGNQIWLTTGNILAHVFAPKGFGLADHLGIAGQAGEVFRAATFYVDSQVGAKIVCGGPSVQGGGAASDDGNWFGVTVAIPFEFYFTA